MFLTGVDNAETRKYRDDGRFGLMATPNIGYSLDRVQSWSYYAADNGCFSTGDSFDPDAWLSWLERMPDGHCLFAVLPDVLGDHEATLVRSAPFVEPVRKLGQRPAFVAQNGCTPEGVPWSDIEAVFIGGDDQFKESDTAAAIVRKGVELGKWTHVGRVNSRRRMRIVARWGTHSVDGTVARFEPKRIHRIAVWLDQIESEMST